jgi:hypothetical protein
MRIAAIMMPVTAGLSAAALVAAGATGVVAATRPAHVRAITPIAKANRNERTIPEAGSPSYLVYGRVELLASGRGVPQYPGLHIIVAAARAAVSASPEVAGLSTPSARLYVRDTSGAVRDLGALPADGDFSLSGTTLVAQSEVGQRVDWWNVATGKHGSATLPSGARFKAAAPNGFIYSDQACDSLFLETLAGVVTSIGKPSGATSTCGAVAADDVGIVVSADGVAPAYMTFASPGTYLPLAFTANDSACGSVDANYAACGTADDDGDALSVGLVPLNGDPAVSSTIDPEGAAIVAGSTLVWTGETGPQGAVVRLHSMTPDGTVTSRKPTVGLNATAAFDKAVVQNATDEALLMGAAADHLTTVVGTKRSPVTTVAFALGRKQIVVNDDRRTDRADSVSTVTQPIAVGHGRVTLGKPSVAATNVFWNEVGVSGRVTVHAIAHGDVLGNPKAWLVIRGAKHDKTIKNVDLDNSESAPDFGLTLVGTHLAYVTTDNRHHGATTAWVYDDATGKTTKVYRYGRDSFVAALPALQKNAVAYVDSHEAIWLLNLRTHQRTRLAKPPANPELQGADVYASGPFVGWSVRAGHVLHHKEINQYVNTANLSHKVTLHRTIYGMSAAGVLLSSVRGLSSTTDSAGVPKTTFFLHPYGGHTRLLLSARAYLRGPQTNAHMVAWITLRGALKAAPIRD